jgi:hypothetical protein
MSDDLEKSLEEQMSSSGKSQKERIKEKAIESAGLNSESLGWKPIPKDSLQSKGMFYTTDKTIRVKAAEFDVVKHYSLMDESDPQQVDEGINEILQNGCKVSGGDFRDLTVSDKLNVFFSIRDWTMMNTKSKNEVKMTFSSRKNGEKKTINVDASMFDYYQIDEKLMKFYDETERCFVIKDETLKEPIKLYVPTVGTVNVMKKYMSHLQEKMKLDTSTYMDREFIIHAQYMIADWRDVDDEFLYLEKLREDFQSMPLIDTQVFSKAVSKLKLGIKPTIKVTFSSGDSEVFPMTFRGYKSLFFVSDTVGRLFGDD